MRDKQRKRHEETQGDTGRHGAESRQKGTHRGGEKTGRLQEE